MSMFMKYKMQPNGGRRLIIQEAAYSVSKIKEGTCLACVYQSGNHSCNLKKN